MPHMVCIQDGTLALLQPTSRGLPPIGNPTGNSIFWSFIGLKVWSHSWLSFSHIPQPVCQQLLMVCVPYRIVQHLTTSYHLFSLPRRRSCLQLSSGLFPSLLIISPASALPPACKASPALLFRSQLTGHFLQELFPGLPSYLFSWPLVSLVDHPILFHELPSTRLTLVCFPAR